QVTAIEENASSKWLVALRETMERAPAGVPVVTVADRESDFFEFLTQAKEQRARFLIRARTDRKLVPEDSEGCASMLEALSDVAALGSMTVEVPSNGSRKARTASIEVRVAQVTIKAPQRRGHARASGSSEPVTVTLIGATETALPAGSESISWVLLTNPSVKDFESAAEKVRWYGKRWGIGVSSQRTRLLVGESPTEVKRPRPRSLGGIVARKQDGGALRQHTLKGACAKHQVVMCSERRCSLVTRFSPVAETVDNARRQQEPGSKGPMRRFSPAGYQRRHGVTEDVETGETFDARRGKLVEEMPAITVSGKGRCRHQGGGSGRSTCDGRAAKRARREGPGPVGTAFVKVRQG
ncbi:MAG: hypothetical protein WB781_26320, partial [Candidatus Sulfotelmatobacter sp.]